MTDIQEIEDDLSWREAELATLRLLIVKGNLLDREKQVFFRAAWSLLYAHFEGFCKFSLTVYYDALKAKGLDIADLPLGIQCFALSNDIKALRIMPADQLVDQIQKFNYHYLQQKAEFPEVDTKSNLWPKTLEDLLVSADLQIPSLSENNRRLSTLVSRRNKIAHGERDMILDYSYYLEFEHAALEVMYDLALAIDTRLAAF